MDSLAVYIPTVQASTARLRGINKWMNFGSSIMWSLLTFSFCWIVVIENVGKLKIAHNFHSSMVNIISNYTVSGVKSMIHKQTATELTKWAASAIIRLS